MALSNMFSFLRRIPLLKQVIKTDRSALREARDELLFTLLLSTLPIWFVPLMVKIFFNTDIGFIQQIRGSILGGELFIYSAALYGPISYIIARKYTDWTIDRQRTPFIAYQIAFPYGKFFVITTILVALVSGLVFGLQRADELSIISVPWNVSGFLYASVLVYVFSLLSLFFVVAFRNDLDAFRGRSFMGDADQYAQEWQDSKRE